MKKQDVRIVRTGKKERLMMTEKQQKRADMHCTICHRSRKFLNLVLAEHVFSDVYVSYEDRANDNVTVVFSFTKYKESEVK